jgi:GNAT superfamily N-acetyltransferase
LATFAATSRQIDADARFSTGSRNSNRLATPGADGQPAGPSARRFVEADLRAVAELLDQARSQSRRLAGVELLELLAGLGDDPASALLQLCTDSTACIAVGCYDDAVAGVAIARQLSTELVPSSATAPGSPPALPVHIGVVVLFVDAGFRGVGVGESLLEHLEQWAVERGATELDVVTLPGSRETKALLEALGYKARALVMHRRLD